MEKTDKLQKDLVSLKTNSVTLESKVKSVDNNLKNIHSELNTTQTLAKKLSDLDSSLSLASELLMIVQIIPAISAAASNAKRVIDTAKAPVSKAKNVAVKVESKVKPVRDKVSAAEKKVADADQKINQAITEETKFIDKVEHAKECVTSLPEGEVKKQAVVGLESFSSEADPPVVNVDNVQEQVINAINRVENELESVMNHVKGLVDIDVGIDSMMKILSPFIDALKEVKNALSHVITIPIPPGYPKPKWCKKWGIPYPCGAEWIIPKVSFSVKDILDGVTGVLRPVMALLEKAMNAFLSPILKALNLDIKLPDIPGIDQLESIINAIVAAIEQFSQSFSSFMPEFEKLTNLLNALEAEIAKAEEIYNKCVANKAG